MDLRSYKIVHKTFRLQFSVIFKAESVGHFYSSVFFVIKSEFLEEILVSVKAFPFRSLYGQFYFVKAHFLEKKETNQWNNVFVDYFLLFDFSNKTNFVKSW